MRSLGLGTRLAAAFLAVAALTALGSALLTSRGLDDSFGRYVERRIEQAAGSAVALAEETYSEGRARWTRAGLDRLAHELVLTGYDACLVHAGRALIDTTRLKPRGVHLELIAARDVRGPDGRPAARLELYALGGSASTPAEADLKAELNRLHLVAAVAGGLLALAAGLLVAGWLSRPLGRLSALARELAGGSPETMTPSGGPPEVREIGQALSTLALRLDRQARARRQLAQDLAHELRTPITLVLSRIEAMQDGVVALDAGSLEVLHTEVLRLTRLIEQIEQLAEAEARPPALRPRPLDLAALAAELGSALAGAFELQGLDLRLDLEPAWARADPDAVRQIVANLLSNALKYVPPGGSVTLSTRATPAWSVLCVADTGEPVGAEEAERIFGRFQRGSAAGAQTGAGLGLTIGRELAEHLGGSLCYAPAEPGNRFELRLPADGPRPPGGAGAAPSPVGRPVE